MVRRKKVFIPNTTDIKVLKTISDLNEKDLYPVSLGVYKILSGSEETEFISYKDLDTYATLLSYSSKHVSRVIMMLLRNRYLEKIYDETTNELYLKITVLGSEFLRKYSKTHKYNFKKKEPNKSPLIIKINKWE